MAAALGIAGTDHRLVILPVAAFAAGFVAEEDDAVGARKISAELLDRVDFNPAALSLMREPHATEYLWLQNASPLMPKPGAAKQPGWAARWRARLAHLWHGVRVR
jgi:hypothetical protein